MVLQEYFQDEQFMDKYETDIKYNMGETCVDSFYKGFDRVGRSMGC